MKAKCPGPPQVIMWPCPHRPPKRAMGEMWGEDPPESLLIHNDAEAPLPPHPCPLLSSNVSDVFLSISAERSFHTGKRRFWAIHHDGWGVTGNPHWNKALQTHFDQKVLEDVPGFKVSMVCVSQSCCINGWMAHSQEVPFSKMKDVGHLGLGVYCLACTSPNLTSLWGSPISVKRLSLLKVCVLTL